MYLVFTARNGAKVFLLDVIVCWSCTVFDSLDLCLHVLNRVGGLDLEGDGLASQCLHEDLHTSTETENEVKGGFLLDVVIGKGTAILELLSGEDETLLIRWDSLLVLDLGLYVVDGVGWLDIEGDGLASEGLDENL